jgi:hypothetical protein
MKDVELEVLSREQVMDEKLDKIIAMLEQLLPEPEPVECVHVTNSQTADATGWVKCSKCQKKLYQA